MSATLEDLFVSRAHGFGVATATPLQRAICRVIEGLPLGELAHDANVIAAFGGEEAIAQLPATRPLEFDFLAAIRTAKTRLACAIAWRATQIVDVSGLAAGEIPRFSFMSLDVDKARAGYDQLVGTVLANRTMKAMLLEEPKDESMLVRHPSGRPIEIVCIAGKAAGGGLVARWSAGALFDEFTRMWGDEKVVNFDHARRAVLGRLLPGAQIISVGSPWAPSGPAYERCQERHGKPTAEHVVVRGTGPMLNPYWWTPARCEQMKRSDPFTYTTDVLGEFADPESTYYTNAELKRASLDVPLVTPHRDGWKYAAALDSGTRSNSWPLVVVGGKRDEHGVNRYRVVLAKQWTGSTLNALSPAKVLFEIRKLIAPYGLTWVVGDQHSADANRDLARIMGLGFKIVFVGDGQSRPEQISSAGRRDAHANRNELFERLKGLLETNVLELAPEPVLLRDVGSVRRRVTQTGVAYHLPKTADGRHADYVAALCLGIHMFATSDAERTHAATSAKVDRFFHTLALNGHSGPEAMLDARLIEHERGGGSFWTRVAAAQAIKGN